jgi:hypothetical protein
VTELPFPLKRLVTGGQTGTDRACLDFALKHFFAVSGWCPKGRNAEDGPIASHYPLQETPTDAYEQRTEWNARDSDGTLIFAELPLVGGTLFTQECAEKYGRPFFIQSLKSPLRHEELKEWIRAFRISVLNVAGPRESHNPGVVYANSFRLMEEFLLGN